MNTRRTWQVLLFGGASGVGKTSVSYRLAHEFRVGLTEVDDFHIVLKRLTTPEQQPALHFFRLHAAEVLRMDDEQMLAHLLDTSEAMSGAMDLVIGNHLASSAPVVLEGDFLLPSLAVRPAYDGIPADGQVRAVFLYEEDEQQILRNYRAREGTDRRTGRGSAGTTASGCGARRSGSVCRPCPPGRGTQSWNESSPHSNRRSPLRMPWRCAPSLVSQSTRREAVARTFRDGPGSLCARVCSAAALPMPVLFIEGADDILIPPDVIRAAQQLIPGSRLELVADAGHSVYFERPDEFNRIRDEFLTEVSP